jgi:hypothetical protein
MPPFGPIKRSDLVFYLSRAGFNGPYPGGRYEYMVKRELKVYLPNPHRGDAGKNLLGRVISRDE